MESNNDGSMKEEIMALARGLADGHVRLLHIVTRLEERERSSEGWEARYNELEKKYNEAVNGAKWLSTQISHLQERLAQSQPEMDQLLQARVDAFKKIKHLRRVLRDLLQERKDMTSPGSRLLTQEEIDEALGIDFQQDSSSSSSSSSSGRSAGGVSDRTVRVTTRPPSSLTIDISSPQPGPSQPTPQHTAHQSPTDTVRGSPPWQTGGASDRTARVTTRPPSSLTTNISSPQPGPSLPTLQHTAHQSPTDSVRGSPPWQIHFRKPPGSAVLLEGPIPWDSLQRALRLTDDVMLSLENLKTSPEINMRVHITRLPIGATIAFLYDPILIDTRQQSYVCDWGREHTNHNIKEYILRNKKVDPIFHVFTYPVNEKNWFYIGAMNWEIADIKNFWPLEGSSRTKIINKLCRRSRGDVEASEMTTFLDTFELKQFCVELKGINDAKISREFARGVLGLPSPVGE